MHHRYIFLIIDNYQNILGRKNTSWLLCKITGQMHNMQPTIILWVFLPMSTYCAHFKMSFAKFCQNKQLIGCPVILHKGAELDSRFQIVCPENTSKLTMMDIKSHRCLAFVGCFLSKTYQNEYHIDKDDHTGSDIKAI